MEEKTFGPIRFIPGENQGRYPFCHSFYIEDSGLLIDPGSDRKRLDELRRTSRLDTVWLSHWHEDHFRHLDLFDDLPLNSSENSEPMLSDLETFIDAYGMDAESREDWRRYFLENFHYRPRKIARYLKDGEIIHLENMTVEVIGTPGHTCGHLAFYFREPKILFMGDYALNQFGPWYGDLYSDIEETIASVDRLRKIPAKIWLISHDTGFFEESPEKVWDEYLNVITKRERKLLNLLDKPHTLENIIDAWIIYGKPREPETEYKLIEGGYMKKHLERLIGLGSVAMDGNRYYKV